jgi:hypothetical protein
MFIIRALYPRKCVPQRAGCEKSISMETCMSARSLAMGLHVTLLSSPSRQFVHPLNGHIDFRKWKYTNLGWPPVA